MKNFIKLIFLLFALYLVLDWDTKVEGKIVGFLTLSKNKKEKPREKIKSNSAVWKSASDWGLASASYYDPWDPKQVGKVVADGIGASGRTIQSGSVAMDSAFVNKIFTKRHKKIVFIEIGEVVTYQIIEDGRKHIKTEYLNVVTPYGKNIFRVDDQMSSDFKNSNYVDFFQGDMNPRLREIGRFNVQFRIVKVK